MQFIRPFDSFDPINGVLPKKLPPIIHHYVNLARNIVNKRNFEEIEYAIATINYLLHEGRDLLIKAAAKESREVAARKSKELSNIDIFDEFIGKIKSENELFTPSAILFDIYRKSDVDIANQDDFSDATWPEYFAVLALAEIAEILTYLGDCRLPDESHVYNVILGSGCAEVGEAMAFAQACIESQDPDSQFARQGVRLAGRKGGIKANEAYNQIKTEYIKWFDQVFGLRVDKSKANFTKAAQQFYRERILPLIENDPSHPLATQTKANACRMLETALRDRRKQLGIG